MTENERQGPSAEEYARHLKAIMEQEALIRAADAAPAEPSNPFLARIPVVVIVSLLFVTVVTHNVRAWTPDPAPQPVAMQERTAQVSLLVAGQRVEAFRAEHGRLPASLEEAGLPATTLQYQVDGDRYRLVVPDPDGGAPRATFESDAGPEAIVRRLTEPLPTDG